MWKEYFPYIEKDICSISKQEGEDVFHKAKYKFIHCYNKNWHHNILHKGLNDEIYVGCNVICDDGLLGIVVESYDNYAKVRAIIDDRANVTGEIGSAGYLCNIEGSLQTMDNGYLLATDIDKNAIISEGDKIITSSVSDRYLYGITIGYISSIEQDSNNLTQTAHITPTVNFTDIKDVLVILDRKQEVNY